MEKHRGVDGGAIYAVEDAVVDWACHLIDNEALSGPAMWVCGRENLDSVKLSENNPILKLKILSIPYRCDNWQGVGAYSGIRGGSNMFNISLQYHEIRQNIQWKYLDPARAS